MTMAIIWGGLIMLSTAFGIFSGNGEFLGGAVIDGAKAAVTTCIGIGGITCFWTGIMEILDSAGVTDSLSRLLRPVISRIFPDKISKTASKTISANISANLLGLGNAATPLGIAAAGELTNGSSATDTLCTLVVLNTASIQLIPTTAAALRASYGSNAPFDIIPAVWLTSIASVTAGLVAAALFRKIWKH